MKKVFSLSTPRSDRRFWLDRKITDFFNTLQRVDFKNGRKKIVFYFKVAIITILVFAILYFVGNYVQPGLDPVPPVSAD